MRSFSQRISSLRDDTVRANFYKLYLRDTLYATALMFSSGTVIQTYLKTVGVGDSAIGLFTSVANIVQVAVFIFFSGIFDRIGKVRAMITFCIASQVVLNLALLPFCFFRQADPRVVFTAAMIGSLIQNAFIGMRLVLEYKLIYYVIPVGECGKLYSVDGIISGVVGVLSSMGLALILKSMPYFGGIALAFVISIALIGTSSAVNQSLRPIREEVPLTEGGAGRLDFFRSIATLIKRREFSLMFLPNLLRGLSVGVIGLAAVFGMNELKMNGVYTSFLVASNMGATSFGSLAYRFLISRKFSDQKLCFLGSTVTAVCLLFMLAFHSAPMFVLLYFIAYLGVIFVNLSVPLIVFKIVPHDIMGAYSAGRMVVTVGGTALSSILVGELMGRVPSEVLFTVTAAVQFICGCLYFAVTGILTRRPLPDIK